tara:strand:- start:953 stop:1081 length:129 start_codon:yes stop_codon:yes gene_type:complete
LPALQETAVLRARLTALVEAAWTTEMRELAIEKLMMLSLRRG